jgi:tetratricopeptide (TPR) repeat protein
MWNEAAHLQIHPLNFPWEKFPWQKAINCFTRLLGYVHMGQIDSARAWLNQLNMIHDTLIKQKDLYKANQVEIQIKTAEAWIAFGDRKNVDALKIMNGAADMEDRTEKHPVTPGEVIPARELVGDMFMQMNRPDKALEAYESDLKKHPNRFNGLYGAGLAAEKSGNMEKAKFYYQQLLNVTDSASSGRPELDRATLFLKNLLANNIR